MNESFGTATWKYWQSIENALPCRSRPDLPGIAVIARIVWAKDGEEWLRGEATRRDPNDGALFVELNDRRCRSWGAWLGPDDVWWEGKIGATCALPAEMLSEDRIYKDC